MIRECCTSNRVSLTAKYYEHITNKTRRLVANLYKFEAFICVLTIWTVADCRRLYLSTLCLPNQTKHLTLESMRLVYVRRYQCFMSFVLGMIIRSRQLLFPVSNL